MSENEEISIVEATAPSLDPVPEASELPDSTDQLTNVSAIAVEPTSNVESSFTAFLAKAESGELTGKDASDFLNIAAQDPELGLSEENKRALQFLGQEVQAGRVKPGDVVEHMGQIVSSANLSPEDKQEAQEVMEDIQHELEKAVSGQQFDEAFVQKKANRLVQIIKIVGMVILAVLGIGAFKMMKMQIGGEQK